MSSARILIVEDEAIIAREIRMILEKLDYDVTSITDSGEAAIERVKSERPDLVLMDINLKGEMDGIQAAALIRDGFDIPVIYLTASVEERKLERAKQTFPAGYILKPFSEHDIRVALEIGLYVAETGKKTANSQKRLAAAERIAGFGSCEVDIQTGRCTWSDEFFRICGYEPGAFEPDADMNIRIIHPDDRKRVAQLLKEAIEAGREYDTEKRIVRPDGSICYVHSLGSIIRDAAGRPIRMIRTIRDVTEMTLLEQRDRLNSLRLEIINDIQLLAEVDEKKVCDLMLERMRELSDSRMGYLGFMTEDEKTMLIHTWSQSAMAECKITDKPIEFSIAGSGLWGEPVRQRGPIVVNDYEAPHEARKGCPAGHVRIRRFMSVPVFDGGRIVALAAVANKEDAYTSDDVNQLILLMQGAWEEIRRKRMEESLRRTNHLLDAVRQAQSRFISHGDSRPVFDELLEILVGMTGSTFGFLDEVLFDADGTPYKLSLAMSNIAWDDEAEKLYTQLRNQNLEFRNLNNLAGLPAIHRQKVIANDVSRDDRAGGLPPGHPRIHSFMGLPVFAGGEIVGVIGVANRVGGYDISLAEFLEPYLNACGSIILAIRMRSRERQMLAKLQENEHRFNSMFEHMTSGAAVYQAIDNGTDFIFNALNRAAEKITRLSRTTVLGNRLSDLFPNMDKTGLPAALKRVWETGEPLYLPPFYYADDKREGWRENRIYKLPFGEVVALFDDVTERMQSQIERERLLTAIEHTAEAIVVTDPEGTIQFVNYAFETMTGYTREEAAGLNPRVLKSGRQDPSFYKNMWTTISCGRVFQGRLINRRKDGRLYTEEIVISPVHDKSGRIVNYVAVKRDITDRQKTEEALRKSETQLRAVFEAADNVAFIITDGGEPDPVIIECSPGAETIFGYSRQEMIGQTVAIFHQPGDFKRIPETRKRMRKGSKGFSEEFTMIRKTGEQFPALLTTYPLLNEKGHMFAALGVAIDISQQKKLEAQLRQSQRMESIGTLAGGIAHDFNNILYPIIGHSEMLIDDLAGEEELQKRVRSIMNSALRAADLVKQILSFSRQAQREKAPVKIQETINDVLLLIRHSIPASVNIVLKIDNACSPVMADAGQIHQVLMNLITNARHALADAFGTLEIGLSETRIETEAMPAPDLGPGRYVDLYVSDTGTGIEEGIVDRIFDPFFTTKEVGRGTGLGLSVSYGIVKQHGGVIRVKSRPGQGSTFHVYLPVITDRPIHEKPPVLSPDEKGRGEHILLVDDTAAIVELVEPMLTRLGYRVSSQAGSLEALEAFRKTPEQFDLLITDMSMPDMTGAQLATEIRRIRSGMPIILCTGFSEEMDEEKASALGINAFLMKPVVRDQLAAAIRKVLDNSD